MWDDLMKTGADREKLDGKSKRILLEMWQQLKPEQQFWPLRTKQKLETKQQDWPVRLQDLLLQRLEKAGVRPTHSPFG